MRIDRASDHRPARTACRAVAAAFGAFCLLGAPCGRPAGAQALAQLTLPAVAPSSSPGLRQVGPYVVAPVTLDGLPLFTIAGTVNASSAQLPLQQRLEDIQTALGEVVATEGTGQRQPTEYDPRTLRIHVKRAADLASLEAVDAKHPDPLPLVTVNTSDARYNGVSVDDLATQWQGVLQSALTRALELRQPAVVKRSFERVVRVTAGIAVVTLAAWALFASLRRRSAKLADEVVERERRRDAQRQTPARTEDVPQRRRRFLALALRSLEPEQRLRLYRALAETLVWLVAFGWAADVIWAFSLFPQTTPLSAAFLHGAAVVLGTVVVTGLLNRLLDALIARLAGAWRLRTVGKAEDRARYLLRIPTIASAIGGFKAFLLVFVAILTMLSGIGLPIGSIVTIGGVAAIALSLAAQSFVRDFVTGFLVLFEDHYVVGDYIAINAYSGLVERLTLRMVQIRDLSGDLITISHSSVTSVVNMSRDWSRVDYRVPVDPAADIPRALALVRAVLESLATDHTWRDAVLEPVEWLGIDELSKDWVIVRASVRTAPLRQFELRREINARVERAFHDAGIGYGAQIPGVA